MIPGVNYGFLTGGKLNGGMTVPHGKNKPWNLTMAYLGIASNSILCYVTWRVTWYVT